MRWRWAFVRPASTAIWRERAPVSYTHLTVFTPRHPVTRPKLERIEASEKVLDIEGRVQEAVDGTAVVTFNAAGRGLDE